MNNFTKGEWKTFNDYDRCGDIGIVIDLGDDCHYTIAIIEGDDEQDKAVAHLIATAGTTATRLAEMGFDAVRVIEQNERLIEIVNAVAHIGVDFGFGNYELEPEKIEEARKLLEQCRGE